MKTLQVLIDWRTKIFMFLTENDFILYEGTALQKMDYFENPNLDLGLLLYKLPEIDKNGNKAGFVKMFLEQLMSIQIAMQRHLGKSPIELFNEPVFWATLHDLDTSDITQSVASIYAVISRKEKVDAPFLNYALCGFYEEYAKDGGWIANPNFGAQFLITQFIAK